MYWSVRHDTNSTFMHCKRWWLLTVQVGAAVGSVAFVVLLGLVLLALRRYLRRETLPTFSAADPSSLSRGAGKFISPAESNYGLSQSFSPPESDYSLSQSFSPPTLQSSGSEITQASENPYVYRA